MVVGIWAVCSRSCYAWFHCSTSVDSDKTDEDSDHVSCCSIGLHNSRTMHSEAMQRVRHEVCNQWKRGHREFDGACEHIACFFEELGTFVKIGAIPKETMWDVQSWSIEYYWGMFEKGIEKNRIDCKEYVYSDFEGMFRAMRKISDAKGAPSVDEASIEEFVKREIRGTKACLELLKPGPTKIGV